jgi:hypothetical protein
LLIDVVDFVLELIAHGAGVTLHGAHGAANLVCHCREPFGADHNKKQDQNKQEFLVAYAQEFHINLPPASRPSLREGLLVFDAVILQIVYGVLHGRDLFRIFIADFKFAALGREFFLERHDELYEVERIGIEVIDEGGAGQDFLFFNTKLLDDNCADSFEYCCHV